MAAIKYPKNHDLRELVHFSAETGHIWLAESRMLMLHVAAMAVSAWLGWNMRAICSPVSAMSQG